MAESLGRATFDVLLDTSFFRAGIDKIVSMAQGAGQKVKDSLGGPPGKGTLASLDIRINSLNEEIRLVEIGSKKYKQLQKDIRSATQERLKAEAGLRGGGGGGGGGLGGLANAAGIGLSVAGVAAGIKGAVQESVEFETITRKLTNTLGSGGAADALKFTRGVADQLGLSYKQLSNDFGSFTAAASAAGIPMQQQQAVFAAVAKAGQSLGLSNDAVSGSLQALQQVASKGTVQMEELRGQLGDRMPIALAATAKGLGISQQSLIGLVESGQLAAGDFFPALTKGLNELTAGGGGAETTAQQFARLNNAWEDLQRALGDTLLGTVAGAAKNLAGAVKFAADNTKTLVAVMAGLGGAVGTYMLIAKATKIATAAQKGLAVAAAIAQSIMNPAGAIKVAAALAVGAGTAAAVGKAIEGASGSQAKLGAETDRTKVKQLEANAAAAQHAAAEKKALLNRQNQQLKSLVIEKSNLQGQEARLGFYAQEHKLVGEINAARAQGALSRSDTIKTLLDQEMKQAQDLAKNDAQRKQIEKKFGQAKFNQTVAEFDLKARALVAEQGSQQASLAFEQQKVAAAGKRAEIEAQIALIQAQMANNEKNTPETQRNVELAQQNLDLIRKQNSEEQALGGLRQQLLGEQQAVARERLGQERLIALNGQAQNASAEQQAQLQRDVNRQLSEQAGYADAAAVSAQNFRNQLQGASEARGDLSTSFQTQVNTVIDGNQQFSQMNTYLSQIATNTGKQATVNVTLNGTGGIARGNSPAVSGTSR